MRLDRLLVERSLFESRNKAQEAIESGFVLVDDKVVLKPSSKFNHSAKITILTPLYVSRAGFKLKYFLSGSTISPKDKVCLDIGASTGGFTEVLLEFGAKEVYAIDVGEGQLSTKLAKDSRVKSFEQTDIRDFFVDFRFEFVTCDLSFIGVEKVINDIDRLSSKYIVVLFKPQFEVGNGVKRDKKGVIRDMKSITSAMDRFEDLSSSLGWRVIEKEESKLKGKEGSIEFFYGFEK